MVEEEILLCNFYNSRILSVIEEFNGTVIHRAGDIIMLKWSNPFGNKIWIATINLKYKKAIVTESYDGLTSFGMNIEILDCN